MRDRWLFKAKFDDSDRWKFGSLHEQNGIYCIMPKETGGVIVDGMYASSFFATTVKEETVCQCTGLKDKNGKLIWENDIVRDDNGNLYKAFWQDRYYQFSWICVKSDKLPIGAKWDFWSIRSYEIDVIGNIFDNPELLEK